jgi:galactokinase
MTPKDPLDGGGRALGRILNELGGRPAEIFRAPGRANLIGEHTDYNGGFVLPVALEMSTYVAGRETKSGTLRLRSLDQPGEVVVDIEAGRGPSRGWGRYVRGVVKAALDGAHPLRGFEGVVASDVPIGAGLASSAALEVAVAITVLREDPGPLAIARMCRRAENDYVGARTGIMDQLAAAACDEGSALFIDCLAESYYDVPFPADLTVLVVDSAVQRRLTESGYNERRAECERAAAALGVDSLRQASLEEVESADMDEAARKRARHVVTENDRVIGAIAALEAGDLDRLGVLFAESHRSMSEDFENSTPEIDALVEAARAVSGIVGARMTGGGFGGCTVNLVRAGYESEAAGAILDLYERRTGLQARFWTSPPAAGAGAIARLGT